MQEEPETSIDPPEFSSLNAQMAEAVPGIERFNTSYRHSRLLVSPTRGNFFGSRYRRVCSFLQIIVVVISTIQTMKKVVGGFTPSQYRGEDSIHYILPSTLGVKEHGSWSAYLMNALRRECQGSGSIRCYIIRI